jgi:hypothetical protein
LTGIDSKVGGVALICIGIASIVAGLLVMHRWMQGRVVM